MKTLKLGTRGSALALKQAEMTEVALAAAFPDLEIERVIIKTTGDRRTDVALNEVAKVEGIWDKGVFIKELEVALEVGEIDVAVHSLKDLPTVLEEPFQLRSVLERAPVADVWIGKIPWSEVKKGSRVGTSSVRRARQIQFLKAGVKLVDLRGNVPTRMGKAAKDADYDGIILAEAGLTRLGYQTEGMFEIDRHPVFVECLAERNFFPAAGQGAVGLEIRRGDDEVGKIIDVLNHDDTWNRVTAEREFLRLLDAGCSTPIGVWSKLTGEHLEMGARVFPEKPGSPRKAKASGVVPLEVAQQLFDNLK
ncbi:MAG: hydroxymethylbilane synthase [Akkermansiaceae bacterium]|jgi:hydroxymethylbilane synthase|tara:strand:+ start:2045 stop:2965 length:921 start_codon:yes stop_codon:yes gene_type:complete